MDLDNLIDQIDQVYNTVYIHYAILVCSLQDKNAIADKLLQRDFSLERILVTTFEDLNGDDITEDISVIFTTDLYTLGYLTGVGVGLVVALAAT